MLGYFENPEATDAVHRQDGWLHTGDLGRFDEDGHLYIVGRKKEVILDAIGENVYPDELEELYGELEHIKELSIVGLPEDGGGGETRRLPLRARLRRDARATRCVRELAQHFHDVSASCRSTSGSRSSTSGTARCRRPRRAR